MALLGSDKIGLFLNILDPTKNTTFREPINTSKYSREYERDTDTEDTFGGKKQKSGSLEVSGSIEGYYDEETDISINYLRDAIKKGYEMTIMQLIYVVDEEETARALAANEIDSTEVRVPSEEFDVKLSKYTDIDGSAKDPIGFSADYTQTATRKLKDADGKWLEKQTYETVSRSKVEALQDIIKEYYGLGKTAPELSDTETGSEA